MTKLIIVRHGYSTSNEDGTITGQIDVPLSAVGIEQAELASDYILNNYEVDAVYSSDLTRATDTVKKIAETLNLPLITDKRLREVFCGKWEGVKVERVQEEYKEAYAAWKNGSETARIPGGETMLEVKTRAMSAIFDIVRDNRDKTVVVATHGGVIKTVRSGALGIPYRELKDTPWATNASVTELNFDGENFSLVKFGYDEYLGKLTTEMPKGI